MDKTLKQLREDAGVKQEEMATLLGISASYYSLLENGRRRMSLEMASKISKRIGVSMETVWSAYDVCRKSTEAKAG